LIIHCDDRIRVACAELSLSEASSAEMVPFDGMELVLIMGKYQI